MSAINAMDILERLRDDYRRFPADQSYDLYAEDVYFKDPLNEFRGVERYRRMIGTIDRWLQEVSMDLHSIEQPQARRIETRWTLHWRAPLPWRPTMAVSGRSELGLNDAGKICSHVDYWDCSRWQLLSQVLPKL